MKYNDHKMDYRIKEDMSIPMNVKMMSANKTGRSNELKNQKTHNEGAMRHTMLFMFKSAEKWKEFNLLGPERMSTNQYFIEFLSFFCYVNGEGKLASVYRCSPPLQSLGLPVPLRQQS